ncbi:MAG: two-component system response regulator [Acidimicrobiales bacterium]|nr:two-component system response regulator [Acidimicrobiales bacterium]
MIRTLVVDDDYRVADVNAAFVAKVKGFEVIGQAHTARAAYETVAAAAPPDLILLDLYLPDAHGLELLRRLQPPDGRRPDVIVITAARDAESVRTALQLGAVSYLVKPFAFDALARRLEAYRALHERLASLDEASQDDVDALYALLRTSPDPKLPKGNSEPTMRRILEVVRQSDRDLDAVEVAERAGVSRATSQRYLAELARAGLLELHLQYGATGRPSHRYRAT